MMMTRDQRLEQAIESIDLIGTSEDTNAEGVRLDLQRFLLIEQNVGSAAHMQSHYLTTHDSLNAAWRYHDGQEYREDWTVVRVVDLDSGDQYVPGATTVEWHPEAGVPFSGSQLPAPPPELADAWERYQHGGDVEPWELSELDEWRADCAQEAGF